MRQSVPNAADFIPHCVYTHRRPVSVTCSSFKPQVADPRPDFNNANFMSSETYGARSRAESQRDVLHLEREACSCVRLILVPGGLREEEISGPPWSHDWLNPRCRFPTWLPCWTANWQTEARFQSGPSTLALPALTQLLLLGNDSLMISCLTSNRHLIDCQRLHCIFGKKKQGPNQINNVQNN